MNTLHYDYNTCFVRKGDQTLEAGIKPTLSFEYEALMYDGIGGAYRANNADNELTAEQITEIEAFIASVTPDATEQANMEARIYLAETDWYVVRKFETGKAIPQEVLVKRAEAREAIT